MQGLQTITFSKVAITGGAFEAVSPVSGDSATFFNVPQGSNAWLAEIWAVDNLHACEISITASRFHDQQFGMRGEVTSGAATAPTLRPVCLSAIGFDQPIFPSDVLSVQVNGTASDDVVVTMLVYYEELPGINARLATSGWVKQNMKNLVGINVATTAGDGVFGTALALNSSDNRLHANTDYALLGMTATLPLASAVIQGIDTGNLRVGGPILADPGVDASMFVRYDTGYPQAGGLIPIINSNNAGSTTLATLGTDQTVGTVDVWLAELRVPFTG
jgi:hypothetical protein